MPLYEYRCKKCGHEFEIIRKFSDGPLRKAPDCPEDRTCRLEKLVSASSFQLKGGGWYDDGYGKKAAKSAAKPADSSGSGSKSGDKTTKSAGSKKKADKKGGK